VVVVLGSLGVMWAVGHVAPSGQAAEARDGLPRDDALAGLELELALGDLVDFAVVDHQPAVALDEELVDAVVEKVPVEDDARLDGDDEIVGVAEEIDADVIAAALVAQGEEVAVLRGDAALAIGDADVTAAGLFETDGAAVLGLGSDRPEDGAGGIGES